MHIKRRFWKVFRYFYTTLYAKMFSGRDILKHFFNGYGLLVIEFAGGYTADRIGGHKG